VELIEYEKKSLTLRFTRKEVSIIMAALGSVSTEYGKLDPVILNVNVPRETIQDLDDRIHDLVSESL